MSGHSPSQDQDLRTALEPDHEFKSHPDVFWPAVRGEKMFEFRKDDRGGYSVGQTVRLRCYDPDHGYHGHPPLDRRITNILRGGEFGLPQGFCILSLAPLTPAQAPDKAGERDGQLESAIVNSMVHLQCALGWPLDDAHAAINSVLKGLSAALTPQPNGTGASRGVIPADDGEAR
jgi:hypothetical protein